MPQELGYDKKAVLAFILQIALAEPISSVEVTQDSIQFAILSSVDEVQKALPDGGGYFMGIKAHPPECPVGFPVSFYGRGLVQPTRKTSYCSGASYTVLMLALDKWLGNKRIVLIESQLEALRMQELDGGRREDEVKFWGWWNADGPGSYYALCEYTNMGKRVTPKEAIPGDFVNISWKKAGGHSAVFLGFEPTKEGTPGMKFWSSQGSTNGFATMTVPLDSIDSAVFVRLTNPENLVNLDPSKAMKRSKVTPDKSPFL
jgi:hypothetical protein